MSAPHEAPDPFTTLTLASLPNVSQMTPEQASLILAIWYHSMQVQSGKTTPAGAERIVQTAESFRKYLHQGK